MAELDVANGPSRIRRYLKLMENEVSLIIELRELAKTDGGRMTKFGKDLIALVRDETDAKQAFVAKLLDITPGAVSQHYNK